MDMKKMLDHCGVASEIATFTSRAGRTIQVSAYDPTNAPFITELAAATGFFAVDTELASDGSMMEFSDSPLYHAELAEGETDEPIDPALGESTAGGGVVRADGQPRRDGRQFSVLTDAETHKFAQKIFTGILHNNDMSRYGAFMYDLDNFLKSYYVEPEYEDEGDDTGGGGMSMGGNGGGGGGDGIPRVPASSGADFEGASVHLDRAVELANNRSTFLKAMMTSLSGATGEAIADAFVNGDVQAFNAAMQKVSGVVAAKMPEPEDEDTGDTEPSDSEAEPVDGETGDNADGADASGNVVDPDADSTPPTDEGEEEITDPAPAPVKVKVAPSPFTKKTAKTGAPVADVEVRLPIVPDSTVGD